MKQFWSGVLFHGGVISLHQDYQGKEEYIKHVNEHWVNASVTVPIALFMIFVASVLYYWNEKAGKP